MSKERLSKLQKWILKKCYEEGKYKGKRYNAKGIDYYIGRRELMIERISEYCEKKGGQEKKYFEKIKPLYEYPYYKYRGDKEKKERQRIRNKLEVSLTNSINNLRDKGYIEPYMLIGFRYQYRGLWLSDKGIKKVEELIINKISM